MMHAPRVVGLPVVLMLLIGLAACGRSGPPPVADGQPVGFELGRAVVDGPDASCELCLWIADEPDLRGRGLMRVTDLGPADGMAFVYDRPRRTSFTMRNTVLPLSIAFFGPDGAFLDSFDMEPCASEPCPSYPTPDGFTVAIEVLQGDLERLGLVAGSRLGPIGPRCQPAGLG